MVLRFSSLIFLNHKEDDKNKAAKKDDAPVAEAKSDAATDAPVAEAKSDAATDAPVVAAEGKTDADNKTKLEQSDNDSAVS